MEFIIKELFRMNFPDLACDVFVLTPAHVRPKGAQITREMTEEPETEAKSRKGIESGFRLHRENKASAAAQAGDSGSQADLPGPLCFLGWGWQAEPGPAAR